jgi:hypothetical protein
MDIKVIVFGYGWEWVGFLPLAGLRGRFLPVVYVRSFQVRNMDSSLGWFMKMTHNSDPWKKYYGE